MEQILNVFWVFSEFYLSVRNSWSSGEGNVLACVGVWRSVRGPEE